MFEGFLVVNVVLSGVMSATERDDFIGVLEVVYFSQLIMSGIRT